MTLAATALPDILRGPESLLRLGDAEGALRELAEIVAQSQWRKDLVVAAAQLIASADGPRRALILLDAALQRHPTSAALYECYFSVALRGKTDPEVWAAVAARARQLPADARVLGRFGTWLINEGRVTDAMAVLERAASLGGNDATIFIGLALGYHHEGSVDKAQEAVRRALSLAPGDATARHLHAALTGVPTRTADPAYIEQLFDTFADSFDRRLVQDLGYRTPQDVLAVLKSVRPDPHAFNTFLDIGCGTGLVAEALAAHYRIERAVGVDLSGKMLEEAGKKGLYQKLMRGDAAEILYDLGESFDVVACIEVPIYVGDLWPITSAVAACLKPGGLYVYSIETRESGTFQLMPTQRFTHAIRYVETVGAAFGMSPIAGLRTTIRMERNLAVPGYVGVLARGADD